MLPKKEKNKIKKDLISLSKGRIEVMKQSRDVVKTSKKLIYAIHRDDMAAARKYLKEIRDMRVSLEKISKDERLRSYGPYRNAIQEYVEAICYYFIIACDKIPAREELGAETETYLMGLSDLTGELMRKGIKEMIAERPEKTQKMRNIVDEIYGLIIDLDFDGGEARRKSDQVKYSLTKLEDILYEAKIRGKI
jgi:predicted translin family RNA/ssDNA-binding protein